MRQRDVVLDRWRRGDEVEIELTLQALLDDLHVEEAKETASEPEAERDRALWRIGEARVVQMELLERVPQQRVILATDRVDPSEHEALGLLIAGKWLAGRPCRGRDGVPDLGIPNALEPGRDIADLAGDQLLDRDQLR